MVVLKLKSLTTDSLLCILNSNNSSTSNSKSTEDMNEEKLKQMKEQYF
mgnify:CR=1 FL=1